MRVTDHLVFRRFWYPVIPLDRLAGGPQPFTLLGTEIVLWLDRDGQPAAARDRCCHRSARLSRGVVAAGDLVCGYHGWAYDRAGAVVRIPQAKDPDRKINFKIDAYRCAARYGYAWVALDAPLYDIPALPEEDDPAFRRMASDKVGLAMRRALRALLAAHAHPLPHPPPQGARESVV
jgi:phenylpropionate dioxygenase-like ring-hydroxylating dioxygenase large terminal subunit